MERKMRACLIVMLALCFLLVNAQRREQQQRSSCRLQTLNAREPAETIRSEGGTTELSTRRDSEELDCAGLEFTRDTIEPNGLSLLAYSNAPKLLYIADGRGRVGVIFPGCPETYRRSPFGEEERECERRGGQRRRGRGEERAEEEEEEERLSRRERERAREESSQKVRRVERGDVLAIPAGTAYWIYNDGDRRLRIVGIVDSSTHQNQLDSRYRPFYVGGTPADRERRSGEREGEREEEEERRMGGNLLAGFDGAFLAETLGVSREIVRKIQESNQGRGLIIRVERPRQGPKLPLSHSKSNEELELDSEEEETESGGNENEETYCSMRLRHNADRPDDAEVYVPDGGRLNQVNRFNLHVLAHLNLAAERGVLRPQAIFAPSWLSCHAVVYATRGFARIQVVDHGGRRLFDGNLREGQFLVIPQFHGVVKRAGEQGFEWVTFATSHSPIRTTFAGEKSALKAMPADILMNSYNISYCQAQEIRWNRHTEPVILRPLRRQPGGRSLV